MPAPPLTAPQKAEAAQLKKLFVQWQAKRKADELPFTQEAIAEGFKELLVFGQSTISQYLNGGIPLNIDAARKFAVLLGVQISDFSPSMAAEATAYIAGNEGLIGHLDSSLQLAASLDDRCRTIDELRLLTDHWKEL